MFMSSSSSDLAAVTNAWEGGTVKIHIPHIPVYNPISCIPPLKWLLMKIRLMHRPIWGNTRIFQATVANFIKIYIFWCDFCSSLSIFHCFSSTLDAKKENVSKSPKTWIYVWWNNILETLRKGWVRKKTWAMNLIPPLRRYFSVIFDGFSDVSAFHSGKNLKFPLIRV